MPHEASISKRMFRTQVFLRDQWLELIYNDKLTIDVFFFSMNQFKYVDKYLPHFFLLTTFTVIKVSTQSSKSRILDYRKASASQKTFRLFRCHKFCAKHF